MPRDHDWACESRNSYNDFLDKLKMEEVNTPQSSPPGEVWERFYKAKTNKITVKICSFIFRLFQKKRSPKKYIFVYARFHSLIKEFPADDVLVIGGVGTFLFCLKNKIAFQSIYEIDKYSIEVIYGDRCDYPVKLKNDLYSIFNSDKRKALLVYQDTCPAIVPFIFYLKYIDPSLLVVCLQHGLNSDYPSSDALDGRNSDLLLVYDREQEKLMRKKLPTKNYEVMGYYFGYESRKKVILVGNGVDENSEEIYRKTLKVYIEISKCLLQYGYECEYRPHPSENSGNLRNVFNKLNKDSINTLLEKNKIYLGIQSTLLLEAALENNLVIRLTGFEFVALPEIEVDIGLIIDVSSPDYLKELITALDGESRNGAQPN